MVDVSKKYSTEWISEMRELEDERTGDQWFTNDFDGHLSTINDYGEIDEIADFRTAGDQNLALTAANEFAGMLDEIEQLKKDLRELRSAGEKVIEMLEYYESSLHEDSAYWIDAFQKKAKETEK